MKIPTLRWTGDALELLDQTLLPNEFAIFRCERAEDVRDALKRLVVRGAPAIGVAAAYGVLLSARRARPAIEDVRRAVADAVSLLKNARPTAVNLAWAADRMATAAARAAGGAGDVLAALDAEAGAIAEEDRAANRRLGAHGAALLKDGDVVLTHCNAGALATVDYGTALGIVYAATEQGKSITVFAGETRPLLQGARLTAWELMQAGIPTTLICDNAAAAVLSQNRVTCVIVGADRIAANGDTANKIGTLGLAVLARHFLVPFYVAAPLSTVDFETPSGSHIPIEERDPAEVTAFRECRSAPLGVGVFNPAFDVTPGALIDAVITEAGVAKQPYAETLPILREGNR